jgi:hypothetical protein
VTRSAALDLVPPAFHWMPEYGATLGDEAADLATLAGFAPDPEQRLALDMLFALNAEGKAAVRDLALVAPRQNLKTGFLKQAALGWLFITEQRLTVWSAHEFSTSQEAFRDMARLIENCPDLDREVQQIHYGNGEESIELSGDRRLKFKARTKAGGRGLTGDKIVLDEAMYLRAAHMGALVPTLRAVEDPQLVLCGSAGMVDSDVWRDYRIRGRNGGEVGLGFLEFCDPNPGGCLLNPCTHHRSVEGCALDDRARWWKCNTALGRRITEETLASDRRSLPAAEFARETLGWWEDPPNEAGGALDLNRWAELATPNADRGGPVVWGVDIDEDRTASITVAWRRPDGAVHGEMGSEIIPSHRVVDALKAKVDEWGGTVAAPTSLVEALERANVPHVEVKSTAWPVACAALVDAMTAGTVHHGNQPELNEAAQALKWGPTTTANLRGFQLRDSPGAGPMFAFVRAVYGLDADSGAPPNLW